VTIQVSPFGKGGSRGILQLDFVYKFSSSIQVGKTDWKTSPPLFVIPAVLKPESSAFNAFWMPDQVRHDKNGSL
jgi:hypothetical protein